MHYMNVLLTYFCLFFNVYFLLVLVQSFFAWKDLSSKSLVVC